MTIELILGDCREKLQELPDNSVDTVVTDPPYMISFMGKKWDSSESIEGFFIPIWKECLRVLKSGSFAFVMCSPRADVLSKQILAFEKAGFRVDFTPIYWTYASGFPKAMNLSKKADKKLGFEREIIGYTETKRGESGGEDRGKVYNTPFREGYDPITKPTSEQAKKLEGAYAGFQPKPAVEIIIVAMKPLSEKSYIDQALKSLEDESIGLGGTWLDECTIPFINNSDKLKGQSSRIATSKGHQFYQESDHDNFNRKNRNNIEGRFPANLLVSDDILNNGVIHKSGSLKLDYNLSAEKTKNTYQSMPRIDKEHIGDSGSFSRFFDLDCWFAEKIKQLPVKGQKIFPFLKVPKTSKNEKNKGVPQTEKVIGHNRFDKCGDCDGYILQNQDRPSACKCKIPKRENNKIKGNFHPTVKPIKLMSYLITLALGKSKLKDTRVVLDCFAGSGTTALAARMLGFNAIVIEKNPEYFELMQARIDFHLEQKKLFDFSDVGVESET